MKKTLLAAVVALALPLASEATTISFGTSGTGTSASATFTDLGGGQLQVVLANTGGDVLVPVDVLTGVFFTLDGVTLSPLSALLTVGSNVLTGAVVGNPAGGNVGGEWAYGSSLDTNVPPAPNGATMGISSSGLGIFGAGNFNGPNLAPPPSGAIDGLQYGIVSGVDNAATGNNAVTGTPLIKNSVTFVLNYTGTLDLENGLHNVSFQYGTALTEPNFTTSDITLPDGGMTLSLLGLALGGLGLVTRRRA